MTRTKSFLYLTTLSLGVLFVLTTPMRWLSPVQAQSQPQRSSSELSPNWNSYEPPPNLGTPGSTEGGGTRGPCVKKAAIEQPILLIPSHKFGRTISGNPTFFVYIPPILDEVKPQPQVKFTVQDQNAKEIYRTTQRVTAGDRILSFTLPATAENQPLALEAGKYYQLTFTLVCNPDDSSGDASGNRFVSGWLQRVMPNAALEGDLKMATSPHEQLAVYAKYGIWFDAVAAIAQLRLTADNTTLTADWTALLQSAGLEKIASAPIIQSVSASDATPLPLFRQQ